MPRASVARRSADSQPTPVEARGDGAIVCRRPAERGRCNKLVLTYDGKMVCPNGHEVELADALCALVNRPDADWNAVIQLHPQWRNLRPLIRRLATPEFLNASEGSWQKDFLINRHDYLVDAIVGADHFEPECGQALRDYWERELPQRWSEVASALAKLKPTDEVAYIRLRELALQAFQRSGYCDPLRYLACSEVSLAAVRHLGGDALKRAPLYWHNITVASKFLTHWKRFPSPALLYFDKYYPHPLGAEYMFQLMPDPHYQHCGWHAWGQISLHAEKEESSGNRIRLRAHVNDHTLIRPFCQCLERVIDHQSGTDGIKYSIYGDDKIDAELPSDMSVDFTDPMFHLKLMKDFSSFLFLRMDHLLESE